MNASEDDCEVIEPLLSLYDDGMASAAEARLVEAHLPACESCREALAWIQATRHALSGRPVLSPPADLHGRIADAIAASEAAPLRLRPARTFVTRPAFAAAASLAAVGLFLGYSLTHLPRPGVTVSSGPANRVATAPATTPSVSAAPQKNAPSAAARKPKPATLEATARTEPDDTPPAAAVEPAPSPRVSERATAPALHTAPKAAPVILVPTAPAPRLRLKPITPHPTTVVIAKMPVTVKHTPALLPTKAPPLVALGNVKAAPKDPNVHILPPTITAQEPAAPQQTASVSTGEPHVQTVDYVREVRAHLTGTQTQVSRTVGFSIRGVAAATRTFDSDRTPGIAITQSSLP